MVFKTLLTAAAFMLLATAAKAQMVYPLQVVCLPTEQFIEQMYEEGWRIYAYGDDIRLEEPSTFYLWTRDKNQIFFVVDYYTLDTTCLIASSNNFEKFEKYGFDKEDPA